MYLVLLLLALGPKELELTLRFPVVMQRETVIVQCRVPKDERNRKLTFGLDTALSTIQLDGLAAPITHRKTVSGVICGPQEALCELTLASGKKVRRVQALKVLGCPDSESDAQQPW